MILKMKKKIKLFFVVLFIIVLNSCYSSSITTFPTPEGYKAQIESQKRITKEKRRIKKYHNKQRKKIDKQQRKKIKF